MFRILIGLVAAGLPLSVGVGFIGWELLTATHVSLLLIGVTELWLYEWNAMRRGAGVRSRAVWVTSFLLIIYRVVRLSAAVFVFSALIVGGFANYELARSVSVHGDEAVRTLVESFVLPIRLGLWGTWFGLIILVGYGVWKFQSTRFAESRIGVLKDVLFQVEETLSKSSSEVDETCQAATAIVLEGLLGALRLSPWQWLTVPWRFMRPYFGSARVVIYRPTPDEKRLKIVQVSYPTDVVKGALMVYKWLEDHYKPAVLDTDWFERALANAKGVSSRGWQKRFLNLPDRSEHVSAAGWIFAKGEVLYRPIAANCVSFDSESWKDLRAGKVGLKGKRFPKADMRWVEVRSFIGCPIDTGSARHGVLFASRNVVGGFVPEDTEIVIAFSHILGRIERWRINQKTASRTDDQSK